MTSTTIQVLQNSAGLLGIAVLLLYVATDRQVARRPMPVLSLVVAGCVAAAFIRVVLLFAF